MDREILEQIWPIFVAESREQLQEIGAGLLQLESGPGPDGLLKAVKRHAHSLKGSAAAIGLTAVEKLAHAIENVVMRCSPDAGLGPDAVASTLRAISAMEAAFDAGAASGEFTIAGFAEILQDLAERGGTAAAPAVVAIPRPAAAPAPAAPAAAQPGPQGDPLIATLDAMEECLVRLGSPFLEKRSEEVLAALSLVEELEVRGGARVSGFVEPLRGALQSMEHGGPGLPRAAVAAASLLVDLRGALGEPLPAAGEAPAPVAAPPPPPVPAPAPVAAAPAEAPRAAAEDAASEGGGGRLDEAIRVRASAVESLSHQVELLTLAQVRQARRAKAVAQVGETLRSGLGAIEAVVASLKARQDPEAGALEEAAARIRAAAKDALRVAREGVRDATDQQLVARVAREEVRDLRMVPALQVVEPLRRAVKEVAVRCKKEVQMNVVGGDVKADRRVLDDLRAPLTHLVRNAVDHGIEAPDARAAAGKPAGGTVTVRVEPRGTRIAVVVEDDGAGIDVARVKATAVKRGVVSDKDAASMSDKDAVRLLFRSGFSTAASVTSISGRGVGLDVVEDAVSRLQGTVDVDFTPGRGTRFTMEVRAALASTSGALALVGNDVVAFPSEVVARALRLAPEDVGVVAGRTMARVGGEQLPFAWLGQVLGVRQRSAQASKGQPALLVAAGTSRVVLAVDEVLGQQELVVAGLGRVAKLPQYSGATVLDDGRVIPVLNAAELVRIATGAAARDAASPSSGKRRILCADDALTTRAAMKALLEVAGYAVTPAVDGQQAFEMLKANPAVAELVVSDVQMPNCDGLELCRRIRADGELQHLPLILVTSLDAPEDRAAGLDAGADGYLVKREVQAGKLLDLVRQLLPGRA
jgi:two-component system chemotaxis sensor kinase CheA